MNPVSFNGFKKKLYTNENMHSFRGTPAPFFSALYFASPYSGKPGIAIFSVKFPPGTVTHSFRQETPKDS